MTYNDKPYTDAVNLPDDHTYTDDQIMQMMLEKFVSWKSRLETPGVITEEQVIPVVEEV